MAVIKILPKNIFKITDFYNLGLTKIKGTSGSIITTSTATNNIGNHSWDTFGGDASIRYTSPKIDADNPRNDWAIGVRTVQPGTTNAYKEWRAIRYESEAMFSQRETSIESNDYINYDSLYCTCNMTLKLPENSTNNSEYTTRISSTSWGSYNKTLPSVIKPSGFGSIQFGDVYQGTDGKWYVKTSGSPPSDDIAIMQNKNYYYMISAGNISYAINNRTTTSFDAKLTFPNRIATYYLAAMHKTGEQEEPPNDPAKWEYQTGYRGYGEATTSLSQISAEFTTTKINELSINTNYGKTPYYKFDENSFFRTDMVKDGKSLFYATSDDIISKWGNGRKSVKLKCNIGEYNDTSGALALSTKDNKLPMFFKIGDIVEPYIVDGQGKTVPLSKNANGRATRFEVLSVKLYTDGACWQDIELLETT